MKRKFLVSTIALLTSLFAVGCSNGANQSSGVTPTKVHKSAKKSSQKSSAATSTSSQDNDSATGSSDSSSSSNNDSSSSAASQSSGSNSNSSTTTSSASTNSGNLSESNFQTVVNDTIKRNGYPAGTSAQDFSVMQSGNQIDVAEKKTGTMVAHYTIKDGHLYYYDVVNNQQVQVK